MADHRRVVDVVWPGFRNSIAVDGVVVQQWRWPGNNLHTWRRFELDGIPCKVVRRRAGLLSFKFALEVGAPAQVQKVEP